MTDKKDMQVVGEFALTKVSLDDIGVLGRRLKYVDLVDEFLRTTKVGDAVEIENPDGTPLDESTAHRAYYGIRNLKRYREKAGEPFPVRVSKHNGHLILTHLDEPEV